jgi:hypothetical protein
MGPHPAEADIWALGGDPGLTDSDMRGKELLLR